MPTPPPPSSLEPSTPINTRRMQALLCDHPDPAFVDYVINGLSHGFDIGYRGPRRRTSSPNLPSALSHPDFISTHLQAACLRQETAGPYPTPPFTDLHCSGLGAVPKKNGKLRPIHHLSAPLGQSVNDGISSEEFSLHYVTVDNAISLITQHGPGAYLAKVDVKSAFRTCPVRREDWSLLGIEWDGKYYFERVLPFGLRSSLFIFNTVADALEWILQNKFCLPAILHYLDDYLNVCADSLPLATQQLDIILSVFRYLGIPLAEEKTEGPSQVLAFLGILLDTIRCEARLPPDKLADLRGILRQCNSRNSITKNELASLLGKLSFAARVVVPGRTFMRRLWDLKAKYDHPKIKPHYRVALDAACRADIKWWNVFLDDWNGRSFFLHNAWTQATELGLYTDASGAWGFGAFYGAEQRWIQGQWSGEDKEKSIEFKELYAIVVACATWGHHWSSRRIQLHCDNEAVVACVRSGTSRAPHLMPLLRCLVMLCARMNFVLSAKHVAGRSNVIADALSRGDLQAFRRHAPTAKALPDTIPTIPWVD